MPELAIFFGIVISVFGDDHGPPHIHASHGSRRGRFAAADWVAKIRIADSVVIDGYIPPRDLTLVRKWMTRYRDKLEDAWNVAAKGGKPKRIPPLRVR